MGSRACAVAMTTVLWLGCTGELTEPSTVPDVQGPSTDSQGGSSTVDDGSGPAPVSDADEPRDDNPVSGDGTGAGEGEGDGDSTGSGADDATGEPPAGQAPVSTGFTDFAPAADSRVVYVSSSAGDDDNDGLSPDDPVASLARADSLVRDGFPDQILLRRGDVWQDVSLGRFKNGRSASEPIVVAYYGDSGPRPLLRVRSNFVDHNGQARSYQSFIGLHLVAYGDDPSEPGFTGPDGGSTLRFVGGGDNILVEDCKLEFVEIVVQSYGDFTYRDFTLRRSMVLDVYAGNTTFSNSARPSGIYIQLVDGVLLEDNVFDHNGWSDRVDGAGANQYNHNIYMQTDNVGNSVVMRGNIVANASSHGAQGRAGGLFEENLFVANAIGLQIGYNGSPLGASVMATARNNVILDGLLMDRGVAQCGGLCTPAVWGLMLAEPGAASWSVDNNVVAHRRDDGSNVGIEDIADVASVTYTDNISHDWGGGVGDTPDPGWPDPDRTVGSYHATLGGTATLDAFLQVVRNRGVGEWLEDYTAKAVNDYIRAGFGK